MSIQKPTYQDLEKQISQLKSENTRLRESEAILRTLIDTIPDLIFLKTVEGKYLLANARFEDLYGAKEKDIIGKTDYDFVDKTLADFFRERDQEALANTVPTVNEEYVVFANDNHGELLETTKMPVFSKDNKIIGVIGVARNITEQKKAEQELIAAKEKAEDNESKFRAVFDHSIDGIVVVKNGRGMFFNPAYLKMLGYNNADELEGKMVTDQIAESERARITNYIIDRASGKDVPTTYESIGLRKNGDELDYEISVSTYDLSGEQFTLGIIRDITQRKLFQRELEAKSEKLSESINSLNEAQKLSHIGSWKLISATGEVTWSKELFNIFERPYDLGAPNFAEHKALYTKESYEIMDEGVRLLTQKGISYNVELDIYTSNGSIRHIISKGQVLKDDDNQVIGCYGTAQDITQLKLTQRELEDKSKKLLELNNTLNQAQKLSHVGSWTFDLASQKVEWSEETFRIWGLNPDDGPPSFERLMQLTHPDEQEFLMNAVDKAARLGTPYDFEHSICIPNGEEKMVRAICIPVTDNTGKVIRLGGVSQDITEIKIANQKIERQNKELLKRENELNLQNTRLNELNRALNEAQKLSHVGSWQWNMATDEAEWSDEMYNIYGVTREDFYPSNENVVKTVLQEDIHKVEQGIASLLVNEMFVPFEFRIKRPSGEIRQLQIVALEKNSDNSIFGVTKDVTEQKKIEAKLLNANKELEVFFYRTSHDLRAPLSRIRGLLQIIAATQNPDEIRTYIDLIETSTDKLNNTLNDLIEIIQVRKGRLQKVEVDIEQLVDEIFETHSSKENQVLEIKKSFEQKIIYSDPIYLKIILRNLISNSIKYSADHRDAYISIHSSKTKKGIEIKVKDNGIGIREEAKEHLFEMFYRGGNESEGAGLGLFIVKDAINKMGGSIRFESEKNQGSTFYVELPLGQSL